MGRYYSGDIEGKFWFGIQDSNDSEFFGGEVLEPNHTIYYFEKDNDYQDVLDGIKKCVKALGEYKQKLDDFFKTNNRYTDKMVAECLGIPQSEDQKLFGNKRVSEILGWYARLELGEKIKQRLDETGYCEFEAEH